MTLFAVVAALWVAVEARICSQAAPCRFGVASCTEATFAPTCTYVFNNQRSFPSQTSAINACTSKFGPGASLVTPGDAATNGAVKNLCPSHRFFDMKRRAGSNCLQWETLDGSAQITYFQWDSGEPSRGGCPQGEGCAGFKISLGNGNWHDGLCTPSGSSDSFVAQCVVCALPPTPAPTLIAPPPRSMFTVAPTPPPSPPPSPPVLAPPPTTSTAHSTLSAPALTAAEPELTATFEDSVASAGLGVDATIGIAVGVSLGALLLCAAVVVVIVSRNRKAAVAQPVPPTNQYVDLSAQREVARYANGRVSL